LGIEQIAEGVETAQQRDRLKELGCTYAQGYLYSLPQPLPAT
jgi:EAL domain-containing protein (putative c-di-GMP-specific phosphodiesterase class I)